MLIESHRITDAKFIPSENFDNRPDDEVSLLVIHGISLPRGQYGGNEVIELFCNELDCSAPGLEDLEGVRVSSHLFVRRTGELIQFVPFDKRAWHAGQSMYAGRERCNDFAVGIELEGVDDGFYEQAQYDCLIAACQAIVGAYPITDIVGHSDIAPGRKQDPGTGFDWQQLREHVVMSR